MGLESPALNVVYLTAVDYSASGFQNATIAAIRSIRAALGSDSTFAAAKETVDAFLANPTTKAFVDVSADLDLIERAIIEAADHHKGAAEFEVNPDDLSLPDPDEDPESEDVPDDTQFGPYSPAVYKTAMALLSSAEGNPTQAFYQAAKLGNAMDNMDFFKEVMFALVSVFPPMIGPNGVPVLV